MFTDRENSRGYGAVLKRVSQVLACIVVGPWVISILVGVLNIGIPVDLSRAIESVTPGGLSWLPVSTMYVAVLPVLLPTVIVARAVTTRSPTDIALCGLAVPTLLGATWVLFIPGTTGLWAFWGMGLILGAMVLLAVAVLVDAVIEWHLSSQSPSTVPA